MNSSLEDNPLYCDCHIAWLHQFLNGRDIRMSSGIKCNGPQTLRNQLLKKINPSQFVCDQGRYTDSYMSYSYNNL